ncbi:hypothetical protein Tsubulata_010628 [Turnera subulata]|uniref:Plant heme peroxidase family profile domain-containing protein n=1 Tax=Turnera subulata TaxID=218843 RepID=A0A9Q0FI07_9ROSI|nr:hypothetical protein Tsubulata_010628 [Turnera subulata]
MDPPQVAKKRGRKPKPKDDQPQQTPTSAAAAAAKMRETKKTQQPSVDEKYTQWKSLVPVLYDWLANHNLVGSAAGTSYLQESPAPLPTDGSVPNTLVIANCEVVKRRVAAAEHISQFNEEARSPFVKKYKTIIHPGEVNRIRELPQNSKIVATHTDSPDVLIWDVEAQPNRHAVLGATNSRPDLILTGHQDNAEFALAMCPTEPYVLSGGKDKSVVLWSIQDHITTSATDPATGKPTGSGGSIVKKSGDGSDKAADGPSVGPRGIYQGHEDTVEDEFCSVGDDSCLILWDARVGTSPAVKVEKAHNADLHCVDWNPHDDNLILTGSADNSVRMFDRRNLTSNGVGAPVYKFEGHKAAVLCVQVGKKSDRPTRAAAAPAGLFFQHAGHRDKVVDFHWNASDPWTVVSVSDDCDSTGGGGTLQIWRMSDLIYRPEDEVLAELEKFKDKVVDFHWNAADPLIRGRTLQIPTLLTTPPMGRKDSFKSWPDAVMTEIPSPQSDFYDLKLKFSSKGFTDRDMVALSGAHTVGSAKCQTSSIPKIYLIIGFLLACLPLVGEGSWRGLPENSKIVATHTDCPDILTGHQDNAEFALAMCPTEPYDHIATSATDPAPGKPTGSVGSIVKKSGDGSDKAADGHPSVGPRGIYQGHEDTVEDVTFCPSSAPEFCSAGDDSCLTLWDARVGTSPAVKVEEAHNADLHCVDWNPHDDNLILAGSTDNSVLIFDRRNLTSNGVGSPVYKFEGHKAAVLCVQWSPDNSSLFGSSAEDGLLNVWDYDKVGKKSDRPTRAAAAPAGLFFQHAGHRDKVVDFHWNAADPWTVVSVSDDCDSTGGGGTLQIWRMNDLIYRPEDEVLAEQEKFKSHVLSCAPKP